MIKSIKKLNKYFLKTPQVVTSQNFGFPDNINYGKFKQKTVRQQWKSNCFQF